MHNAEEYRTILREYLNQLEAIGYKEVSELMNSQDAKTDVLTINGKEYQIETEFFWDDARKKSIRIMASLDLDTKSSWWHLWNKEIAESVIINPEATDKTR